MNSKQALETVMKYHWSQIKLNPKDYGKTWALTKEGLKNEI